MATVSSIRSCALPPQALLARYGGTGAYTDCFVAQVDRQVSHAEYVETFYTGALFRVERRLLAIFMARPSTDAQVRQLASGATDRFAAWRVEDRCADQLLLCDVSGRTRSWLMVSKLPDAAAPRTALYFGSAVVPARSGADGAPRLGIAFALLLGFHKWYSRCLLESARSRLARPIF